MLMITFLIFSFLATIPHEAAGAVDQVFVTGSETFTITLYSVVKEGISTGSLIQSEPFTVAGYQWVAQFYPQGYKQEVSDYISIYVRLTNTNAIATAIFDLRLVNWKTSTWSTDTPTSYRMLTFQPNGGMPGWGFHKFIKRSDLEASNYLQNDKLRLKTTLWVISNGTASASASALSLPSPLPSTNMSTGSTSNAADQVPFDHSSN